MLHVLCKISFTVKDGLFSAKNYCMSEPKGHQSHQIDKNESAEPPWLIPIIQF